MKVSQISEEDMKKQKNRRKKVLITTIIGIILTIGIVVGVSYSWWMYTATQESVNTITSDCINLELMDIDNSNIVLENAYPLTDTQAKELKPYAFKITNTCSTGVEYNINLEILETNNRLASEYIAILLDNASKRILNTLEEVETTLNNAVEGRKIETGTLEGGKSKIHYLNLWMDEHVTLEDDVVNKSFKSKIVIEATSKLNIAYTEKILNGADPVLAENLIPVEISNTGVVTKANVDKKWYSYENKEWANAVILEDESITYENGEKIPESNIESYFVWIPKYAYKIQTLGTSAIGQEKAFEIKFGTTNTSDEVDGECTTPSREVASGDYYSGNCQVGDYMTHPAFISMGTNGLWVGKFETGYNGSTSVSTAQKNETASTKVQIKPNVYSWRSITVSNAFYSSYDYKREYDSHMMKNTEWGAVAYITNSIYGKCTGSTCETLYINNNSNYITGWSGTSVSASSSSTSGYAYTDSHSVLASTTGNYTGIYDMSGGANEYVMGVRGSITAGSAGFSEANAPGAKYYDIYNANSTQTQYRILGDATAETAGWNSDFAYFVSSTGPWFARGGNYSYGVGAGVFASNSFTGAVTSNYGFRVVLSI